MIANSVDVNVYFTTELSGFNSSVEFMYGLVPQDRASNVFCSGSSSCNELSIGYANSVYCSGGLSCKNVTISNINVVYALGESILDNSQIKNVDGDIFCIGWRSCIYTLVKNVKNGNVIAGGHQALSDSTVSNVYNGTIFAIGANTFKNGVIKNCDKIIIGNTGALNGTNVSNVTDIEVYADNTLSS